LYYFVDDASANPTFYADLRKPQSLNKYQYSFNNPLRYVDPDGHDPEEPEPQDPKPVVPVPVPIGPGLPVPVTISPNTPGPTDQQIIEGAKSVLDTVTYYTGIDALADWLRPKIMPTPAPTTNTPTTAQPTTAQPTTGTPRKHKRSSCLHRLPLRAEVEEGVVSKIRRIRDSEINRLTK